MIRRKGGFLVYARVPFWFFQEEVPSGILVPRERLTIEGDSELNPDLSEYFQNPL